MNRPEYEDVVGGPAPLTVAKARQAAQCLTTVLGERVKSVHVHPKLHEGQITFKVYMRPLRSTEVPEPSPFLFNREDLVAPQAPQL